MIFASNMNNFEEASLEEVNQLGELASSTSIEASSGPSLLPPDVQPDLVTGSDNLQPSDSQTAPHSESLPYTSSPTIVTVTHSNSLPDNVPVAPVVEPEILQTADEMKDPLKTEPDRNTPTKVSEMDSVSLSDTEDVGEESEVEVRHVIVNETQVKEEVEKDNSAYLLERIRELKDERDQVTNHYLLFELIKYLDKHYLRESLTQWLRTLRC